MNASAGGAIIKILREELRHLHNQKNIKDYEYHSLYMDKYEVIDKNIILKLNVETKWPSILNDDIPIPNIFDFVGLWKDENQTAFDSDVILERKISPDEGEVLKVDWEKVVNEGNGFDSNSAICFLELSLPDDQEAIKKHISHPTEEYDASLQVGKSVDKIDKLITAVNRGKKHGQQSDIDSFPDPDKYSYNVNERNNVPSKIEHVERVQYNLDIEKEGFEKERMSKTYITIENIDISGETGNIQLNYED